MECKNCGHEIEKSTDGFDKYRWHCNKITGYMHTKQGIYGECLGCGCTCAERSPSQSPPPTEDGSKDARICACCKRSLPEDVEICFQCVGYSHFEPKQDDVDSAVALPCRTCGNLDWGECEYSSIPIDLKNEDGSCGCWEPIKPEEEEAKL